MGRVPGKGAGAKFCQARPQKFNLCSVLLSSSRRAEATGRNGRLLAALCLPGTLRHWEPGDDFESVTLASAGDAECWAGGAWSVFSLAFSLLFLGCVSGLSGDLPL